MHNNLVYSHHQHLTFNYFIRYEGCIAWVAVGECVVRNNLQYSILCFHGSVHLKRPSGGCLTIFNFPDLCVE